LKVQTNIGQIICVQYYHQSETTPVFYREKRSPWGNNFPEMAGCLAVEYRVHKGISIVSFLDRDEIQSQEKIHP
jgi:hypothetical protein